MATMFGHLSGGAPEEGQICYGSFVWVIIFLPLWGSPGDPPLPRNPPANACTFESGTCRAAHP